MRCCKRTNNKTVITKLSDYLFKLITPKDLNHIIAKFVCSKEMGSPFKASPSKEFSDFQNPSTVLGFFGIFFEDFEIVRIFFYFPDTSSPDLFSVKELSNNFPLLILPVLDQEQTGKILDECNNVIFM